MNRLVRASVPVVCLILLCFSGGLFAQSEVGSATLNGRVLDPSGASVAGARVTATSPETGFTRSTETTEAGLYTLNRLPAGKYELTVEFSGFKQVRRTDIVLNVGAVATLDVALEVGAASEQVTVTAEVPVVETTRSQTSTVVNEKAVRDLPINNRNFLDFATLTPGVVRDPRGGDLSFGGQRGPSNSLLIDGGDSNNLFFGQSSGRAGTRNPYTFSQESVAEFQVNANSYGAEIGRAGGGVINVISRSGTNELHGSGFWFGRRTDWNANRASNKWTPSARFPQGLPRQRYVYDQFGGNVGGPMIKDKLFFFFNYDGQRNADPVTLFVPDPTAGDALSQQGFNAIQSYLAPYTTTLNNDIYLTKIDWNISPNQQINGRVNIHRFKGQNYENTSQTAQEGTGNSNVSSENVAINYNRVIGNNKIWDSRFIYLRDAQPGTANSEAPQTVVRQAGQTAVSFGRNSFSPRYTNTKRYQTIQTLSWVKGAHTFKFGTDLNFERIDNFFPGNFSGVYTFNSYADFAARRNFLFTQGFAGQGTTGPLTKPNINEYAFFAQDSWRVNPNLTLNYGIRYDLMDSADPKVLNENAQLLAANLRTNRMNLDTNNLAGRFGFAYRLFGSDRQVIRGGAGMFYGRTPAIVTGTAHSQNGIQVQVYELRPGDAGLPVYPNVLSAPPALNRTPSIYVFEPDYQQPLTYQWSLNYETQFARDFALTVGYLGVRGQRLTRTRDINLFPTQTLVGSIAGGGGPIEFQGRTSAARPNTAFGRISLFDSGADSIYHGGFVQLTKRFSQNFQLLTSYTFSKVIDTVPDATSVVPGGGDDAKVAQDTLLPNLDRAVGDAHTPHRFVFSGVWDMPYARSLSNVFLRSVLRDYQLSVIANASSGRFFSQRVNIDLNNDGNNRTDRVPGVGRNTLQLPAFATLDVRVSRDILLGTERARVRLMFEAFNVTNRTNITGQNPTLYNVNLTAREFTRNPAYLFATTSGDPRILQLAAKFIF
jgi:hypothetical protein